MRFVAVPDRLARRLIKRSWKQWRVIACMATVAVPALAQSKDDELVVNGKDWLSASMAERKAFLVGVAAMIMAEGAYAKRNNQATPVAAVVWQDFVKASR